MSAVIVLIAVTPLLAIAGSVLAGRRVAQALTVAAGLATLGLSIALAGGVAARGADDPVDAVGFLRADALSAVFVLATAFLYAATSVYAIGYQNAEARLAARAGGEEAKEFRRYSRRFYVGMNIFAWSMLCAPLVDGLALLWVAIEITTVVSALLVAIDDTEGATEAAWKYVLIASSGLGVALLGTIVMYYAGAQSLGQSYDLAFDPLLAAAHELPPTPVRLAFVFAVVGFGTKVGLFPVHTWLPDAHSEAPTPISALLSGSLLAVSLYAILRYYQVAVVRLGPDFPQYVLLLFGVLSLLLAALYVIDQNDVKRLLAYSSVEHMGILTIGVSFGTRLAAAGVLLHVLGHAVAKGNAFMGAGVLVRTYGTKSLTAIRGVLDRLPWSGPLFLIAILALSAFPPFSIFRSEFEIVAGGLQGSRYVGAAVLVSLVTLAFLGLGLATTKILFPADDPGGGRPRGGPHPTTDSGAPRRAAGSSAATVSPVAVLELEAEAAEEDEPSEAREPSVWMVVPPVVGVLVLVLLGIDPPGPLVDLLQHGAALLGTGAP